MDPRSILLAFLPVGLTLINYAILRDLLWGILLGSKSKKAAEKARAQAQGFDRFTQRYMKPHITKYADEYKFWMITKVITAAAVIAQIIAFVLLIVLKVKFWIVAIVCGVIVLANIILFAVMMNQTATSTNKKSTKGNPWKFEQ